MRYIEIQEGITLKVDCIEGIEKIDDVKCKVYTHHHTYEALLPYQTLVSIIKYQEDVKQEPEPRENNLQFFAG